MAEADPNVYSVTGSHEYTAVGTDTVTVAVTEPANGDTDLATAAATPI